MKKVLSILAMVLVCISANAKSNAMSLQSGSVDQLINPENTVWFVVDYDKAIVHDKDNDFTLKDYLKHRGDDFVADWNKDQAKAYSYIPVRYNQKNKKGAKALESEGAHNITADIILTDIDFGNGAGAFVPFGGAKAGGCIISGSIVVKDAQGNEIAVLPFKEVKGLGHVSETIRLGMAYFELMNNLGDVIKDETKKKK